MSNPAHCGVYPILHYVIKFVRELRQVLVFSWYSVSPPVKLTATILLLKVALNTINHIKLKTVYSGSTVNVSEYNPLSISVLEEDSLIR